MGQKLKYLQSVFNKGRLSPRLKGRVDNQGYYKGYDDSLNVIPFVQGGLTFRGGSAFVKAVKDSTKDTIIVSFRFSTVQNYIIEFGDLYCRFYRNRGRVETSPGVAYEVVTPYTESELRELYFFQSADVLYILHKNHQPRKLVRSSDTSWALTALTFVDGPYYPINTTTTTLAFVDATNIVTASTATFTSGDVGRAIRIKSGSTWRYGTIDTYSSATSVTITLSGTGDIAATVDWRLGVFGGSLKYPAVGSIFEERLLLANTTANPATIWGSETGDFNSFAPSETSNGEVLDTNGFSITIGDDEVNDITWMSSGRQMLIGTIGADYSMTGGTSSGYAPITPSNVTVKRESKTGSAAYLKPHRVGNAVLYASQSAQRVRELYYEFGIDSYISRDVTVFSNDILKNKIKSSALVQEPDQNVWYATEKGGVVGFLYEKNQEVEGFHNHVIAGENAKVISLAVIPRPTDKNDELWMIVERTVDGSTVKYIEYMSPIYEDVAAPIDGVSNRLYAAHLDSHIMYDGFYDANITLSALTGSGVTVTASASVFSSADVGRRIAVGFSYATVTAYSSATSITVTVTTAFTSLTHSAGQWSMQAKEFSGASHLEDEIVSIVADGYVTDDKVISSGEFEIDNFASVVIAGLKYDGYVTLLPPDFPQSGTIIGREYSLSRIHIYVTDTYGVSVENETTDVTFPVKFLSTPLVTFDAPALYTGLLSFHPSGGYNKQNKIKIIHDTPLPFTLNYIVQDLDVNS